MIQMVSYSLSEFGRIGISEDRWVVNETAQELPEHKRGYHPAKGLAKKFTEFYEGVCHVRFNRKTFPKKGKSVLNGCFVEYKKEVCYIWEYRTRALLGCCTELNLHNRSIEWSQKFKDIK